MQVLFDGFSTTVSEITNNTVIRTENFTVFGDITLINTTEYFNYKSSILTIKDTKLDNGIYGVSKHYFTIETALKNYEYYKNLKHNLDNETDPEKLMFENFIKYH